MTSAHHPQTSIAVSGLPAANLGETGAKRGLGSRLMLGAAKREQSFRLHLGAKRAAAISPVNQISRGFLAPRNPITRTARVFACRQVSRVSFGVSHFDVPSWLVAHVEQSTTAGIPHGDKPTARDAKVTARGGNA